MLSAKSQDVFIQFKTDPSTTRQNPQSILGLTRAVTQQTPIFDAIKSLNEENSFSCRALMQRSKTQFRRRKKGRKTLEPHLPIGGKWNSSCKGQEAEGTIHQPIQDKYQLEQIKRKMGKTPQGQRGENVIHYSKTEGKMKNGIQSTSKAMSPVFEKRFKFLQQKYRHLPKKELRVGQPIRHFKTDQDATAQVGEGDRFKTQQNPAELCQTPSKLHHTLVRKPNDRNKLRQMLSKNLLKQEIRRRMPTPISISIGQIFKQRYKVEERIGRGLSGEVYRAHDILSDRVVALKVITGSSRKEEEYQFYKTIEHKNVVQYYNNFTHKQARFLVLEYFPLNLHKLIKQVTLHIRQVKHIIKNVCSGLLFLHGMSIAHRDIKLDNVVVTEDLSVVKIIDFGLCVDLNLRQTPTINEVCGTLPYMAPQMLMKKDHHPKKVDIWALGIMLYRLLFDRYPYRGRGQRDLLDKIQKYPLTFPSSTSDSLIGLIRGMLCRQPQKRMTMLDIIEHRWLYE